MATTKVTRLVHAAICELWTNNISCDYEKKYLFKEDALKNAFYFHLRTKLGDKFLDEHNLRIFTEFIIFGKRVDLAIVEIDLNGAGESHLRDNIRNVLAVVEMKYKSDTSDNPFIEDVEKVMGYLEHQQYLDCHYYLAFIQEVFFDIPNNFSWLTSKQMERASGRVTELTKFIEINSNTSQWSVKTH